MREVPAADDHDVLMTPRVLRCLTLAAVAELTLANASDSEPRSTLGLVSFRVVPAVLKSRRGTQVDHQIPLRAVCNRPGTGRVRLYRARFVADGSNAIWLRCVMQCVDCCCEKLSDALPIPVPAKQRGRVSHGPRIQLLPAHLRRRRNTTAICRRTGQVNAARRFLHRHHPRRWSHPVGHALRSSVETASLTEARLSSTLSSDPLAVRGARPSHGLSSANVNARLRRVGAHTTFSTYLDLSSAYESPLWTGPRSSRESLWRR